MVNQEVVAYLQRHMRDFPLDDLRRQLAQEGISDLEFDEALKVAQRMPALPTLPGESRSSKAGLIFLCAGVGLVVVAAAIALLRSPPAPPAAAPAAQAAQAAQAAPEESGFVGHNGYVIRLPPGYTAVQSFKDEKKTVEIVHFCKTGTDQTQFQDSDLFGQLGIVRLEVTPNPFLGSLPPQQLESLTQVVSGKAQQRGEKFHLNNPQGTKKSTLPGVEITVEAPFPRLQAYFLGEKVLYTFTAGQDDEIYRGIVTSLRETQASN